MTEDADLRSILNNFREKFIVPIWGESRDDRMECVLRRKMIDWLVKMRPTTVDEWWNEMPAFMQGRTNADQFEEYAEQIIAIIRRHTRDRGVL